MTAALIVFFLLTWAAGIVVLFVAFIKNRQRPAVLQILFWPIVLIWELAGALWHPE